ncbi:MAG: hypothetical protein LBC41_03285 [Clostridiales bacterium]|jgi:hypothetical protein|nr:hypothetical protein [Clostridiales bacterium]
MVYSIKEYEDLCSEATSLIVEDNEKSLEIFNKLLEDLDPKSPDNKILMGRCSVLHQLVVAYIAAGKHAEAIQATDEIEKLVKTVKFSDDLLKCQLIVDMAMLMASVGEHDIALKLADLADPYSLKNNLSAADWMLLLSMIYLSNPKGSIQKAKRSLITAISIYSRHKNEHADCMLESCIILSLIADQGDQDNDKALSYCNTAWAYAEKAGLNLCSPQKLYLICVIAYTKLSLHNDFALWSLRCLPILATLLDEETVPYDISVFFIFSNNLHLMREQYLDRTCTPARVAKALKILSEITIKSKLFNGLGFWLSEVTNGRPAPFEMETRLLDRMEDELKYLLSYRLLTHYCLSKEIRNIPEIFIEEKERKPLPERRRY